MATVPAEEHVAWVVVAICHCATPLLVSVIAVAELLVTFLRVVMQSVVVLGTSCSTLVVADSGSSINTDRCCSPTGMKNACESNTTTTTSSATNAGSAAAMLPATTTTTTKTAQEEEVARYRQGRTVYRDGSPAHVPAGCSTASVPRRYLLRHGGNAAAARKAYAETQQWRARQGLWTIHKNGGDQDACGGSMMSYEKFAGIKAQYPLHVHGKSRGGDIVVYEETGKMNVKEMFAGAHSVEDYVRYVTYLTEFIYVEQQQQREEQQEEEQQQNEPAMVIVMDMKGADSSQLRWCVQEFRKSITHVRSNHYPLLVKRVIIINAPFYVTTTTVRSKLPYGAEVTVASSSSGRDNYLESLLEYIDADQIPAVYGGTSPHELGNHPLELRLHKLASSGDDNDNDNNKSSSRTTLPMASRMSSFDSVSTADSSSSIVGTANTVNNNNNMPAGSAVTVARSPPQQEQRQQQQQQQPTNRKSRRYLAAAAGGN